MNTQQSYAGRATSATALPPTAKSAVQPPTSADDWQTAFLHEVITNQEAKDSLFKLLYLVWDYRDSPELIDFISHLFEKWVTNPQTDLNTERYNLRDLMNHLSFLNKLRSEFEFFDDNSDYTSKYKS